MIEILMATFNSEAFLDAQIRSLFEQSYPHFTLTVRDNRSTDSTLDRLKKWQELYPNRIQLHTAPQHGDALSNFSALLQLSKAEYLAFCDSDDVWLPHKLAKSVEKLKQLETRYGKQTPCLVYTDLIPTDAGLHPLASSFWKESGFPARVPTFSSQLMRNRLTGCTLLFNRALALSSQPIPKEALMHDAWLGLVATAFGQVALLNEPTLLYRQHAANQLGSVPCSPLKLLFLKKIPLIWKRRFNTRTRFMQGKHFLQRYEKKLSPYQRDTLDAFLKLPKATWFEALRIMKAQQFYEPTWVWTLYTFLFRLK